MWARLTDLMLPTKDTSVIPRSLRAEIRNPVLGLASFKQLWTLDADVKRQLSELLTELGQEAAQKAQNSWTKNKAPMAVYWKAVSVYARHIARALRRPPNAYPEMESEACSLSSSR